MQTGNHLKNVVTAGSIGGLFFALIGTGLVWAGTDSLNCPTVVWKISLAFDFSLFIFTWIAYIPFRNTDLLLGNGILMAAVLLNLFSTFWFGGFYFYFLFAPINKIVRATVLIGITAILLHRAYKIRRDIANAFQENKKLLRAMYCDDGELITFKREAIRLLERARRERSPFRSVHLYAAMLVFPFVFMLNKLLTPVVGEGHGIFLILAFFSMPMMLWGVDIFIQTIISMVYYPIKLHRETGKNIILKDW